MRMFLTTDTLHNVLAWLDLEERKRYKTQTREYHAIQIRLYLGELDSWSATRYIEEKPVPREVPNPARARIVHARPHVEDCLAALERVDDAAARIACQTALDILEGGGETKQPGIAV